MSNKFNVGGMMLGWWNEGEEKPQHMMVDLVPLVELAERDGWTEERLFDRIQGFTDAFEMIARNNNITARQDPMSHDDFRALQVQLQQAMKERMKREFAMSDEDVEPVTPSSSDPQ